MAWRARRELIPTKNHPQQPGNRCRRLTGKMQMDRREQINRLITPPISGVMGKTPDEIRRFDRRAEISQVIEATRHTAAGRSPSSSAATLLLPSRCREPAAVRALKRHAAGALRIDDDRPAR